MPEQMIAKLWKDYYPRIVFYIRHAFPGLREEAEDLCQEAFVRAQRATLEREHTRDAVAVGIAAVEASDREICYLYYFEDLKVAEIGRLIRRPSGTVKYRLSRIRAALKKHLEARHEN